MGVLGRNHAVTQEGDNHSLGTKSVNVYPAVGLLLEWGGLWMSIYGQIGLQPVTRELHNHWIGNKFM